MKQFVLASIVLCFAYICRVDAAVSRERAERVQLGETTVTLHIRDVGRGPTLIRVHEDEETARDIGIRASASGARFVDLEHGGGRFVMFELEGVRYGFDPNRIYSEHGIAETLTTVGHTDSPAARAVVRELANRILHACGGGPIIALHNNKGSGYGIPWYENGGQLYRGKHTLVSRESDNLQNFIVVTDEESFELLAETGQNVVLQDPANDIDDGSMSYYFGIHEQPYFNIEAAHGDIEGQWVSLLAVYDRIGRVHE
jgi:hypothetical protein